MANGTDRLACSSRRELIKTASALAAAALAGIDLQRAAAAAEPPPETTRLRLLAVPAICLAPQYVAESLLRAEGFTDIE